MAYQRQMVTLDEMNRRGAAGYTTDPRATGQWPESGSATATAERPQWSPPDWMNRTYRRPPNIPMGGNGRSAGGPPTPAAPDDQRAAYNAFLAQQRARQTPQNPPAPGGGGGFGGGPPPVTNPGPAPAVQGVPGALPTFQMPSATNPGHARRAIDALRSDVELNTPDRVNVPELQARAGNWWDAGPGQFSQGVNIPSQVFSAAQIDQLATQRAAPTLRALQDQQSAMAAAAARGGRVDPARLRAMQADAALNAAGAMSSATRDAQLDAASANAEQALRAAESGRADFTTDLQARLGLGDRALAGRGQELDYTIARGGLDVQQRGQDANLESQRAALRNERDLSRAQLANALYGTQSTNDLRRGELALQARGQDAQYGLGRFSALNDANLSRYQAQTGAGLDADRLRLAGYQTQTGLGEGAAERQNRLQMLERELASRGLDRNQQAELERLRLDTMRDLQMAEINQRAQQFGQSLGLQTEQLGLQRDELGFRTGEAQAQRDFAQQMTNLGLAGQVLGTGGMRQLYEQQFQQQLARALGLLN